MNCQVIKLANGEDIIANVEPLESGNWKVTSPLKMSTHSKMTETGMVESLGLSRWVQVYSDQPHYNIQKNGVIIMTPASEGLCRYYEYVLKSMHETVSVIEKGPSAEELDAIENEILSEWDVTNKVYH